MSYSYEVFDSPLGSLTAASDSTHLRELHIAGDRYFTAVPDTWQYDSGHPVIQLLKEELGQYFAGTLTNFSVPIKLAGTDFQKKVWQQLQQVAIGSTTSYAQLAFAIGRPNAVRAVGTAVGKNPICIVVPCHRVIASSGKLGGYVAGIERKVQLLKLEGIA